MRGVKTSSLRYKTKDYSQVRWSQWILRFIQYTSAIDAECHAPAILTSFISAVLTSESKSNQFRTWLPAMPAIASKSAALTYVREVKAHP